MNRLTLACGLLAFSLQVPVFAVTADEILAKMDRTAPQFKTMTADFARIEYTAVIKDTSEDTGKIALQRKNYKDVRFRIDFQKPEEKSVDYADRKMQVYLPKANTVQIYDFGKQGKVVDEYLVLLLGFGTPGSELKKSYKVTVIEEGQHNGVAGVHLQLLPLGRDAQKQLKMLDLWVDSAQAYPMEQKLILPSGDTKAFRYTNVKINPALSDDQVRLKLPKTVHKETPQKG